MAREVRLLVGTRKGAFCLRSRDGRASWQADAPIMPGWSVSHIVEDPRDPARMYLGGAHMVWGPKFARSVDGGHTWEEPAGTPAFAPDEGRSVASVWCVRPGHARRPGEVWAGVDPAALFRSEDWGATWQPVPGINNHPTREGWQAGGGGLILHEVSLDPSDPRSLIVTISAGGAFRSTDGGESWQPINRGIRAEFLPEQEVPAGHCVHRLVRSATNPRWLFQQNHCGVYRSDDGGDHWTEVTEGLPSEFGFAAAMHPHEERTAYVAPLVADAFRAFHDGAMAIWRTRDGGDTWEALRDGLPQQGAYLSVYRQALTTDREQSAGIYVGTSTGQIFFSPDDGDHWRQIADYLPPITALEVAAD